VSLSPGPGPACQTVPVTVGRWARAAAAVRLAGGLGWSLTVPTGRASDRHGHGAEQVRIIMTSAFQVYFCQSRDILAVSRWTASCTPTRTRPAPVGRRAGPFPRNTDNVCSFVQACVKAVCPNLSSFTNSVPYYVNDDRNGAVVVEDWIDEEPWQSSIKMCAQTGL
jgi:hypothetical protein